MKKRSFYKSFPEAFHRTKNPKRNKTSKNPTKPLMTDQHHSRRQDHAPGRAPPPADEFGDGLSRCGSPWKINTHSHTHTHSDRHRENRSIDRCHVARIVDKTLAVSAEKARLTVQFGSPCETGIDISALPNLHHHHYHHNSAVWMFEVRCCMFPIFHAIYLSFVFSACIHPVF